MKYLSVLLWQTNSENEMGGNEAQMVEKRSAYQTSAGQDKIEDSPGGTGLETISESTLKKQYEKRVIHYSGLE